MMSLSPDLAPRVCILFVDDERAVLDGLRRGMHGMRAQWDMLFATSSAEALALMDRQVPDVVISDMRMPGMSGQELMAEVKRRHPQMIRFILSGFSEARSVMNVAGSAHQYLAKPCDSAVLKAVLERALALRRYLSNPHLIDLVGNVEALPTLPRMYERIVSCLQGPDPQLADVARIISSDIGMTGLILKLANSAFFGAKQTFRTAERAVAFLGLETIAALVLAHSVFDQSPQRDPTGTHLESLWQHSLTVATGARALARHEGWTPERVEEAFLAGLLHDIGRLVVVTPAPKELSAPQQCNWDEVDTHDGVGAYLLGLWGFSDSLVEAVAYHHYPSRAHAQQFGLVGLLHVADRFAHQFDPRNAGAELIDLDYVVSLGMGGRLSEWQKVWSEKPT